MKLAEQALALPFSLRLGSGDQLVIANLREELGAMSMGDVYDLLNVSWLTGQTDRAKLIVAAARPIASKMIEHGLASLARDKPRSSSRAGRAAREMDHGRALLALADEIAAKTSDVVPATITAARDCWEQQKAWYLALCGISWAPGGPISRRSFEAELRNGGAARRDTLDFDASLAPFPCRIGVSAKISAWSAPIPVSVTFRREPGFPWASPYSEVGGTSEEGDRR